MLSVLLAVLAAGANAAASVLQRVAARRWRDSGMSGVRLMWHQLREPPWLAGIAAMAGGFALQIGALATGPIALVQPLLVLELGFTLLLSGVVFGAPLHRREWTAVAGMSVGLALLLAGLSPTGGDPGQTSPLVWAAGSAGTLVVVAVLIVVALRRQRDQRAEYLGVATGIMFGFTAVLVAAVTNSGRHGPAGLLTTWQTYAVVVLGPAGFFLLQERCGSGDSWPRNRA